LSDEQHVVQDLNGKMEFHFSRGNNFLAFALYGFIHYRNVTKQSISRRSAKKEYTKWHMYLYELNTVFVIYEWNMDLVCTIVRWVFDFVANHHVWFFVKNQKQNMGGCGYFRNLKRTGGF